MLHLLRRLFDSNKKTQPVRPRPLPRLSLERLEDRIAPATFTVADTNSMTLINAIIQANKSPTSPVPSTSRPPGRSA
jgi:hypothetical protein